MSKLFAILLMIFLHVVADYNLQGWLASAKQKSYWKENAPEPKYKYDYIWALIMHSFAWTFMVMLPVAYVMQFNINADFAFLFIMNIALHAVVDHMKANLGVINLWQDQLIHMFQIATMATLLWL